MKSNCVGPVMPGGSSDQARYRGRLAGGDGRAARDQPGDGHKWMRRYRAEGWPAWRTAAAGRTVRRCACLTRRQRQSCASGPAAAWPRPPGRAQAHPPRHEGAAAWAIGLRPDRAALSDRARLRPGDAGADCRVATRGPRRPPALGSRSRRSLSLLARRRLKPGVEPPARTRRGAARPVAASKAVLSWAQRRRPPTSDHRGPHRPHRD